MFFFPHQQIMKDKWINAGYDGKELKPYSEPVEDLNDTTRIGRKNSLFSYLNIKSQNEQINIE